MVVKRFADYSPLSATIIYSLVYRPIFMSPHRDYFHHRKTLRKNGLVPEEEITQTEDRKIKQIL